MGSSAVNFLAGCKSHHPPKREKLAKTQAGADTKIRLNPWSFRLIIRNARYLQPLTKS